MGIIVEIAAWLIVFNFIVKFYQALQLEVRKSKRRAAAQANKAGETIAAAEDRRNRMNKNGVPKWQQREQ